MTCDDFQLRITAFSLGELEEAEVPAARDHVAACDRCASKMLLDRQLTAARVAAAAGTAEARRAAVSCRSSSTLEAHRSQAATWSRAAGTSLSSSSPRL